MSVPDSTSSSSSTIVTVTGAAGYIAGQVIDQLIRKGYKVRGTVRSLKDPRSVTLQKDFPALQLFEAELTKPGSFDESIAGARYIFHTASPTLLSAENPQRDIVDPAVKGTETVISAALKEMSVERIVMTSSIVTFLNPASPTGRTYTEADWNDSWPLQYAPYQLSKTLAERKAWELVNAHNSSSAGKSHHVRLVTILPGLVWGPPVGSRVNESSLSTLIALTDGTLAESGVPPMVFALVDVRHVAAAHIAAAKSDEASGRYIVMRPDCATFLDFVPFVKPLFPGALMPTKLAGPRMGNDFMVDNSRSTRELGIQYESISEEQTVRDSIAKLRDVDMIKV